MPELVKFHTKTKKKYYVRVLNINIAIALVNHSCAPNATENCLWSIEQESDEDPRVEFRTIKNEARR